MKSVQIGAGLVCLLAFTYWLGVMDGQSRLASNPPLSTDQWQMAVSLGEGLGATRAMKACLEQRGLRDERPATQPGH